MERREFGTLSDGRMTYAYTIANKNGMSAVLCDFGATAVSILVPGADGKVYDVALGYDDGAAYESDSSFFGASVGRNANRTANARVEIDGVTYQLEANDNENNLHSGANSTAKMLWTLKEQKENAVTFSCTSGDGEQGFPGEAVMEVTYTVTDENALEITYHCTSDKTTVMNMTNHTYFNLDGQDSGEVYDQKLMIRASGYTPVSSAKAIPTGEIADVAGTPFDFREAKAVGQDINADNEQLSFGSGYDHNFVIDRQGEGLVSAAVLEAAKSGIRMEVLTDLPGVQLYTANFIGGVRGKGGHEYVRRGALCLETQYFPNAAAEERFEMPLLHPGESYDSKTVYRFF